MYIYIFYERTSLTLKGLPPSLLLPIRRLSVARSRIPVLLPEQNMTYNVLPPSTTTNPTWHQLQGSLGPVQGLKPTRPRASATIPRRQPTLNTHSHRNFTRIWLLYDLGRPRVVIQKAPPAGPPALQPRDPSSRWTFLPTHKAEPVGRTARRLTAEQNLGSASYFILLSLFSNTLSHTMSSFPPISNPLRKEERSNFMGRKTGPKTCPKPISH